MSFTKPLVYEVVTYEDRMGIQYERVEGQSLLEQVLISLIL